MEFSFLNNSLELKTTNLKSLERYDGLCVDHSAFFSLGLKNLT